MNAGKSLAELRRRKRVEKSKAWKRERGRCAALAKAAARVLAEAKRQAGAVVAGLLLVVGAAGCDVPLVRACVDAPPARPEGCAVAVFGWPELGPRGFDVVDEPWWRCDAVWCDVEADDPPPGVDVGAVALSLQARADAAHQAGRRLWLNLSWPEVRWLAAGKLPPLPVGLDVLSFDRYEGRCGWPGKTRATAEQLAHAAPPGLALALVVEPDAVVTALAVSYACATDGQFRAVVTWP